MEGVISTRAASRPAVIPLTCQLLSPDFVKHSHKKKEKRTNVDNVTVISGQLHLLHFTFVLSSLSEPLLSAVDYCKLLFNFNTLFCNANAKQISPPTSPPSAPCSQSFFFCYFKCFFHFSFSAGMFLTQFYSWLLMMLALQMLKLIPLPHSL